MYLIVYLVILAGQDASRARPGAVDLKVIPRRIAREPVYQSGQPRYCLLVYGPEARTRIWLVLDGRYLYVDRNGNGNLTEKGKRKRAVTWGGPTGVLYEFGGVTLPDGKKVHLRVCRQDRVEQYDSVAISVDGVDAQLVSHDAQGLFKFADRPQDAPIIHFGGPMQIVPLDPPVLRASASPKSSVDGKEPQGKTQDLTLRIGTPGLGPGTFAFASTDFVPENVHPVAEIKFPNKQAQGKPIKGKFTLKERC